jgi:hypothetical protein
LDKSAARLELLLEAGVEAEEVEGARLHLLLAEQGCR